MTEEFINDYTMTIAELLSERFDDIETIRVHIRHLRTKLEPDPR